MHHRMSYQVLARKWRPKIFREMVGQEHVLQALINALDHNRLHHAYLFTGTRGVGKTTIARILAKCLNCETGVSSQPCETCSACKEISEGRFVDLIEVDAASRTKVEDTRELLDNVQYAPTRGRYKIYIIDEVHMLSSHSFNALLKTLEEPPEHVKFLLATTDPQKLPVTILSRCLQFNLKNMSPERIVAHLQHVLTKELIPFDDSALWLLARSADGSMRDALSLTDQAISFGNGKVAEVDVTSMLGTIDQRLIQKIIEALISEDGSALLQCVAEFAEQAPDYNSALAELLSLLHRIAIAQALPEALDNSYGDKSQILDYSLKLASEDVQLFYQTALIGRRDLNFASSSRAGFEMTLLRMLAFKPQGVADIPTRTLPPSSATSTHSDESAPTAASSSTSINKDDDSGNIENQGMKSGENEHTPESKEQGIPATDSDSASVQVQESSLSSDSSEIEWGEQSESVLPVNVDIPTQTHSPVDTDTHVGESDATMQDVEPDTEKKSQPNSELTNPVKHSNADIDEANFQGISEEKGSVSSQPKPNIQNLRDQIKEIERNVSARHDVEDVHAVIPHAANVIKEDDSADLESEIQAEPPVSPLAKKMTLNELSVHNWIQLCTELQVKGILSSTVVNSVLVSCEQNTLQFILDETKASLFDASHGQRLADILSDYFNERIKAHIMLGATPVDLETPADYYARRKKEMRAEAIVSLNTDPVIVTLREKFGATLDENSIEIE